MKHNDLVNLLWTGGWDSTFRLCDLLLLRKKTVQPFYIIDPTRKSFAQELQAIHRIREALERRVVSFHDFFLPVVTVWLFDIAPCPDMTRRYQSLRQRYKKFGSQFEWVARFAHEHDLSGLELSIEANSFTPAGEIWQRLIKMLVNDGGNIRLSQNPGDDDFELFRRFDFPLINTTKLDMLAYAQKHGFADIMHLSWFCHSPRKGRPCGICSPCRMVQAEGLGYRVPSSGKYRFLRQRLGLRKR